MLVPGGSCPTVGISGLALGGGNGVLARQYGLTADAIRSRCRSSPPTAACSHPDASNHADLLLGEPGRRRAQLRRRRPRSASARRPIPPLALFTLDFPWAAAGDLVGAWMEWIRHAPDALWSNLQLL